MEIALNMLQDDLSVTMIAECTKLSEQVVRAIARENGIKVKE